jgi:hypothetical protein
MLPQTLLTEALSVLSPAERGWVLRRFAHILRDHPSPSLDSEAAAFVRRFDTNEARIALAEQLLASRGTEERYAPWRVADYLLDLNHEHSSVMRHALQQEFAARRGLDQLSRWR